MGLTNELFKDMEIDALGEIMNISMGSSATSVSELLDKRVNITTPRVEVVKAKDFNFKKMEPAVGVEINYIKGIIGTNVLILKETDVMAIVGLLLGTEFTEDTFELNELNISAICEVMNQMMGAASTALSQFLNRSVNISTPESFLIGSNEEFKNKYYSDEMNLVTTYFNLTIGDVVNSEFISILTVELAKELLGYFGIGDSSFDDEVDVKLPDVSQQTSAINTPIEPARVAPEKVEEPALPSRPAKKNEPTSTVAVDSVIPKGFVKQTTVKSEIRMPQFEEYDESENVLQESQVNNLNLIMSVPLQVTVEIGRTRKKVKDILDFGIGTVVELDKQAGSQADIFVNGKQIARGDVVVVDDYYGVKITEISSNKEILDLL